MKIFIAFILIFSINLAAVDENTEDASFDFLPLEIIFKIINYLDFHDQSSFFLTDKYWDCHKLKLNILYSENKDEDDIIRQIKIHPNIKDFEINWHKFDNLDFELLTKELKNKYNLTKLKLNNCTYFNSSFENFNKFDNLQELSLSNSIFIDRSSLIFLTNLNDLQSLSLSNIDLVDLNDLNFISNFKKLKNLKLCNIAGNDISFISPLKKIKNLNLEGCQSLKNINCLSDLSDLGELNISHCKIKNIEVLNNKTKLNKIDISYRYNPNDFIIIKNLTNLKELNISSREDLNKKEFLDICHLNITDLNISSSHLNDEDLIHISKFLVLHKLSLHSCNKITANVFDKLRGNYKLIDLDISECRKIKKIKNISILENLEILNVSKLTSKKQLKYLKQNYNLTKINYSHNKIHKNELKNLVTLTKLYYLNISHCNLKNSKDLNFLKNIKYIFR